MYRQELRVRATCLWEVIKRVIGEIALKPSDGLGPDLEDFVHQEIDVQTVELADQLFRELSSLGLGGGNLAVQDERDDARRRLSAEIDLFVAALKARVPLPAHGESPEPSATSNLGFLRRFWERHSGEIIAGLIVTVLGGLIVALIL